MSNSSHDENGQRPYSETDAVKANCSDNVAFLAALQETQNVLNVLLQAVLYGENADSEEEQNQNAKKEIKEVHVKGNSKSINLPENSFTIENLNNIMDLKTAKNQSSSKRDNISLIVVKEDQQVLDEQLHITNANNIIRKDHKEDSCLSDIELVSQQTSAITYQNTMTGKYDTKNNANLNDGLPTTSSALTRTLYRLLSKKLYEEQNTLKDQKEQHLQNPLEVINNDDYDHYPSCSISKEQEQATENPKKEEEGVSKVEEPNEFLQFSQEIYMSDEAKAQTILNNIVNNSKSEVSISSIDHSFDTTQRPLEPRILDLQREISLRGESDNRKPTILNLPPDSISNTPSRCEREVVGDDLAKTKTHIICECERPGVAGGAVPVVVSLTVTEGPKETYENESVLSLDTPCPIESRTQKPKHSLIPKLTNSFKNANKLNLLGRTEKQRCLVTTSDRKEKDENKIEKPSVVSNMLALQEKLQASTSLIKQKISNAAKPKEEKTKKEQNEKLQLRFDEESFERREQEKKLRYEFSKRINSMMKDVVNLREMNDLSGQMLAVERLNKHITKLKNISDKLNDILGADNKDTPSTSEPQDINDSQIPSFESGHTIRAKDNKIYIKFLPNKFGPKKRKCTIEVQTESNIDYSSNVAPAAAQEKSNGESIVKDVDSMDGMFIPSLEVPLKMEEDEDEDGLDITITFPEFQQHIMHQASSHLSVCFSDISAEALGRLKRCPKEFTLRMDFVNGKMFFQSGRSPANNFSIGQDLKITECVVDNKMSDIISIKPSTECMYNSQIIPVEGTKQKSSIRTLKSTDSELFNVVSLPTINRKTSGNTKSCITLQNAHYISSTRCMLADRRSYRSMPQIPSLTRILEEPAIESATTSRAAMMNSDKKPRNRTLPKKKNNMSLEKLSEA